MKELLLFFAGAFTAGVPIMLCYLRSVRNNEILQRQQCADIRSYIERILEKSASQSKYFSFLEEIELLLQKYLSANGEKLQFSQLLESYVLHRIERYSEAYELIIGLDLSPEARDTSDEIKEMISTVLASKDIEAKMIALLSLHVSLHVPFPSQDFFAEVLENPLLAKTTLSAHFGEQIETIKQRRNPFPKALV